MNNELAQVISEIEYHAEQTFGPTVEELRSWVERLSRVATAEPVAYRRMNDNGKWVFAYAKDRCFKCYSGWEPLYSCENTDKTAQKVP